MAEYSRIARGSFTSTGAAKPVYLPFKPNLIKITNYSAAATPANHGVPYASWDVGMGQGYAVMSIFNATPVLLTDYVTSNGFSTFDAGLALQFGAQKALTSISKASPAVVTCDAAHGYATGDVVIFQGLLQSSTTGMQQIAGIPFVITVTGSTTFTIPYNTNQSNFTALSGSPSGAYVKKVLYPFLYAPGTSVITALSLGTTTVVSTASQHNLVVGSEVAFRIPSSWGTTQLNSLPNNTIPGSPVYGYVTAVGSSVQFTVNIDSSSYTAFNSNPTFTSYPGLSWAEVVAVGDINSGGVAYSGTTLYPSPVVNSVSTIGGPAINGAFVNNTRQGFIVGAGVGVGDSSAVLVGANGNVIYWEAVLSDM